MVKLKMAELLPRKVYPCLLSKQCFVSSSTLVLSFLIVIFRLYHILIFMMVVLCSSGASISFRQSGPGCSKPTTSLVNVSLKFQTLISQTCQYFLLKNCEKLLHCKSFSHFFNKKYQCIWSLSHKTLNEFTS